MLTASFAVGLLRGFTQAISESYYGRCSASIPSSTTSLRYVLRQPGERRLRSQNRGRPNPIGQGGTDAAVHDMLADIPIVRLRDGLPERLRKGSSSYSAAVAAAQLALQPPHLCLDLASGAIDASGLRVDLTPASLATLALFARRATAGLEPLLAPPKGVDDLEWAERFLTEYRAVKGELQEDDETLVALRKGMDNDYFSQRLTRLHHELKQALGPVAHWYRIDNGGTRPGRYRLPLEREQVRFGELRDGRHTPTAPNYESAPRITG